MVSYKLLEGTKVEVLHEAFVEAFSDYQVKIDLPLWKFQSMIRRRGFIPEKSIGAFEEGKLVGFILNGYREWNGKPTVYDVGTGVIPEFRKKGLTTSMFLNIVEQLKAEGVQQYLLEVLQQNTSAFELYKKQGFEISRTFSCFKLEKAEFTVHRKWETEQHDPFGAEDWIELKSFWDMQPSWQNSVASVTAVPEEFYYSIVRNEGKIIGYGIVDKRTGDIPQLAVAEGFRGKGIAASLLEDLALHTEASRLALINVDDNSKTLKGFLEKMGFENHVDQYEMILEF